MTKERLRAYRDIKREKEQLVRLMETSTGNELRQYYRQEMERLDLEQLAIEKAINSLDSRERTVLRLYYIEGLNWEQVAVKVNYSWTATHNIHSAALDKLKLLDNGRPGA